MRNVLMITKILFVLYSALLSSQGVCQNQKSTRSSAIEKRYAEARSEFSNGNLVSCQKKLEPSLHSDKTTNKRIVEESAKLLGICYYLSGNKSAAHKAFVSALAKNPNASLNRKDILDPTIEPFFLKIKAENQTSKPNESKAKKGQTTTTSNQKTSIIIRTNTPRATVFDDGIFIGAANKPIEIDPGKHNLTISAEGFIDVNHKIDIKKSQEIELKITLKKPAPPPKPAPKPQTPSQQKQVSRKNINKSSSSSPKIDYESSLPGPKKGASLADEFAPPQPQVTPFPAPRPMPQQKSTAELLAPSSTPAPYSQPPTAPAPQHFQRQMPSSYPTQPVYAPQPIYAPQPVYAAPPVIIQQPPVLVQPAPVYQQPYPQPQYQPYTPQPTYIPPQEFQQYSAPRHQQISKGRSRNTTGKSDSVPAGIALLPLGIGQFYKGDFIKGLVFAGAQAGGVGWAIYSYMNESNFVKQEAAAIANDDESDPTTLDDNFDPDQAKGYKSSQQMNQYIGYGIAGAAWLIGVIDAMSEKSPSKKRSSAETAPEIEEKYAENKDLVKFRWSLFTYGPQVGVHLELKF